VVREDAILATNTSSLSVTEISVATVRPRRVVGMHFFNPAPVQEFVEVIKTVVTEPDVVEDVLALARKLARCRSSRRTARASSRTRCCSAI